jgi:membrane-associated protease RseP (regulator of RpoE activity)
MKPICILLAGALIVSATADPSGAQPILNRVEQFLREQVNGAREAAPTPAVAEPGYLGLTADDRQDLGRGVRIVSVAAGGPAAQAGLLKDDLITGIDGQPIRLMDDMARALEGKTAGTKITVAVNRVGVARQHDVTLGRRAESRVVGQGVQALPQPAPPAGAAETAALQRPRLGLRTIPVSEDVRRQQGLPSTQGATVIVVTAGSPAEQAGIPLGSVITGVDNRPIDTPQALAAAIGTAGDEVELTYVDRGISVRKRVALAPPGLAAKGQGLQLRGRPLDPAGPPPPDPPTLARPAAGGPAAPTAPARPAPSDAEAAEGPTLATPPPDAAARIAELEARIGELEARLEKLEAAQASQPDEPN